MKKIGDWVSSHQLISFFFLTFIITWGLGFSYGAVIRQGKIFLAPLLFSATCGPALAGIIITVISNRGKKPGVKNRNALIAFITAWITAIIIFLAHFVFINNASLSPTLIGIIAVSTIPVAFIINLVYSRNSIIKNFQVRQVRKQKIFFWIVLAFILMPALCFISVAFSQILGRSSNSFAAFPASGIALIGWIALKFLYQFFFFNGTGEEAGWRGFALPRLQRHVSPLIAALLLSLIWVPWHLFLWQAEGRAIYTLSFWYTSYLMHIPASVIICWIFNRSKGSILAAGITHAAANTAMALFGSLDTNMLALTFYIFVIVIVFVDHMWRKLPADHPAVHDNAVLSY